MQRSESRAPRAVVASFDSGMYQSIRTERITLGKVSEFVISFRNDSGPRFAGFLRSELELPLEYNL